MVERKVFTLKKCNVCQEPIQQVARGRPRLTCSDACKQARYRFKQGKTNRKMKRKGKLIEKRRSRPFIERSFNKKFFEPVHTLSEKRWVYECMACGKPYLVERILTGGRISEFCSNACWEKTDYHWKKFENALARAHMSGRRVDERVLERLDYMKLSPLCPYCERPFPPNTTLFGDPKPGRKRKYCSDACRKAMFERRWKKKHGGARRHRNHECAECGTKFDRTDSRGLRRKRFCSEICGQRFKGRAEDARRSAKLKGRRGISGRRKAMLKAPKNKAKRELNNRIAVEATGGEPENEEKRVKSAENH
jgi:hypothetical protein